MDQTNPVVLRIAGKWHIVEHSRRSTNALCGKKITERGAHVRLARVGEPDMCPKCLKYWQEMNRPS